MRHLKKIIETIQEQHASEYNIYYEREELSDYLPSTLLDWVSDIKYMYSKGYLLTEMRIVKELLYYKSFHKEDYIKAKKIIIDKNGQE